MNKATLFAHVRSGSPHSTPLVTIIIPSYNSMSGTRNIERTLRSLINQTYRELEILVIDSHSKDLTRQVCSRYPVQVFQLDGNRSEARNYGIRKMHGDYVLFADTDHVLTPNMVEDCVNTSLEVQADCVMIPVTFVSDKKTILDCAEMRNLEFRLGIGTQTHILFYSKECIQKITFPESVELGEDMIFSSRILEKDPMIARTRSTIYHVEDGTIRKLVLRSWNYGQKFKSTVTEIGAARSARFILSLSSLNVNGLSGVVSAISGSPATVLSFLVYTVIKHAAFALSYCISLLDRGLSRASKAGRFFPER